MSTNTNIEWTDTTWNPTRGCSKISPGCKNCYAKTFAERFRGVKGNAFECGFDLKLVPHKLLDPLFIGTPKKIFTHSMSDPFHQDFPTKFIRQTFRVMKYAHWHTYQVLTKRPGRMKKLMDTKLSGYSDLSNIWLGVSVENKKHGIPRIEILKNTPARVRFLSIEPLLEDLGTVDLAGIDWVIVGGESGPYCRPIKEEWVRCLRDQCRDANIPFFFKQWGGRFPKENGRELDGKTYNEYPRHLHLSTMAPCKAERQQLIEKVLSWYPKEISTKTILDPVALQSGCVQ